MAESVDGRSDQLLEDSFSVMLAEDPVDQDAVLAEFEEQDETLADPAVEEPREGTEAVIARLSEQDPGAARIVRTLQQDMSRMRNETSDLQRQIIDVLTELKRLPAGEAPATPAEPQWPEGTTPEHIEMFTRMSKAAGLVPRSELAEKELAQSADAYANGAMRKGVELYGDHFGQLDEAGNVVMREEVKTALREVQERLFDPKRGLTALELFQLAFGQPAKAAPQNGTVKQPARGVARPNVARRSTGGGRPVRIYDPKRGDTSEDVFDRAFVLARRELGQSGRT